MDKGEFLTFKEEIAIGGAEPSESNLFILRSTFAEDEDEDQTIKRYAMNWNLK